MWSKLCHVNVAPTPPSYSCAPAAPSGSLDTLSHSFKPFATSVPQVDVPKTFVGLITWLAPLLALYTRQSHARTINEVY